MSLAKINGLFRLTRDAEMVMSQSGTAIVKLGLACSEKYKDKETQLFLDAVAFGRMGEIILQYAGSKGTQIYLSGKLQTESWEKDGQKRSKTSMTIEGFDFVSNGSSANNQNNAPTTQSYQQPNQTYQAPHENVPVHQEQVQRPPEIDIDEDNIPFNEVSSTHTQATLK